jgi:hypothetical protein
LGIAYTHGCKLLVGGGCTCLGRRGRDLSAAEMDDLIESMILLSVGFWPTNGSSCWVVNVGTANDSLSTTSYAT